MIGSVLHTNYDTMKEMVKAWGKTVPDEVYVISCLDPTAQKLKLPKARHMNLRFLDLDVRQCAESRRLRMCSQEGVGLYTVQQAKLVAGFVKALHAWKKPITLYVHCPSGLSRSVSMAHAIRWWIGEGTFTRWELAPNPWVFYLTMAALIAPKTQK